MKMNRLSLMIGSLVIGAIFSFEAMASTDYQPASKRLHTIAAECLGDSVIMSFTTRGPPETVGLNAIRVNGQRLSAVEIFKVNALLRTSRLAGMQFLGCRRTQQGDIRHWFQIEPALTPQNANSTARNKWFYVRLGKVESHDRQPVD